MDELTSPARHDSNPSAPLSELQPSVSRMVHLFCPARWTGARPAIVTGWETHPKQPEGYRVNVHVLLDAERDAIALRRSRPVEGDWSGDVTSRLFSAVDLYGALDPIQRPVMGVWAEWMPYQVGQARKKEEAQEQLRIALSSAYDLLAVIVANMNDNIILESLHDLAEALDELDGGERAAMVGGSPE